MIEKKQKKKASWDAMQKKAIENLANGNGISINSTEKGEDNNG